MGLTNQERKKFAEWLLQQELDNMGLVKQMTKTNTPNVVIEEFRRFAIACKIVRELIEKVETQTIT